MLSSRSQYYDHKIYVTPFREKAGDDSERTRSSLRAEENEKLDKIAN